MTNENFYQKQGRSPLRTFFPFILQYGGLMEGIYSAVSIVSNASEKIPKFSYGNASLLIGGLALYIVGKTIEYKDRIDDLASEYKDRTDDLASSFTHLEETLREEFKKNNQFVR